jgi:hypothetical protein
MNKSKEDLAKFIYEALDSQSFVQPQVGDSFDDVSLTDVLLDGQFDLEELAEVILDFLK